MQNAAVLLCSQPGSSPPAAFSPDPLCNQLLCVCSQWGTENSDVWESLTWPVPGTGRERRKYHQWAKEVLETERKPGSKKVFFPLTQRLLDYTQKELVGVPEKFYITLNSSHSFPQEGRERRVPSVSQQTLKAFQQLENSKPMTSH